MKRNSVEYTFKDDSARIAKQGLESEFDNSIENVRERLEILLKNACTYKHESKTFKDCMDGVDDLLIELKQLQDDLIKILSCKEVRILTK